MARLFKSTFGSMLITEPLVPSATMYPSPLELMGRVIIKHKKLGLGGDAAVSSNHHDDISASIMQDTLFVEDKVDHTWAKVCHSLCL